MLNSLANSVDSRFDASRETSLDKTKSGESTEIDTTQPSTIGDSADAQIKPLKTSMASVENAIVDRADSLSSDDSEPVSDNRPITPSDVPPPLISSMSEPVKPMGKLLPIPLPRGPARMGGQGVATGLRAPLMSNTSATPIPPSLQARLAAVRLYFY